MTLEPINPADLPTPATYTQVIGDHKPADTLVGVEALSNPEFLIEVDAIAVVDG